MCTKNELNSILQKLTQIYRSVYGENLVQVILYGSYARGDYHTDSDVDVVAIVQAADEPFNLFSDGSRNFLLRPLIGIITKVDSPHANLPMVRQWMENMGCERIFEVNNVTREGIDELMEYLKDDLPKLTLEQAKFKQSLGLNEWQPLPEGVEYPKDIR